MSFRRNHIGRIVPQINSVVTAEVDITQVFFYIAN